MLQATRTVVQSAPELWAEIADPDALARHLGTFGAVEIVDCEQEKLVRWEAEAGHGELELEREPDGVGTRVRLRAEATVISESPAPEATTPAEEPRGNVWQRLTRRKPAALVPPEPAEPIVIRALGDEQVLHALRETLDALDRPRHEPFSRA